MWAKTLWFTGSAIFLVLGTLHLFYTFFSDKFKARNTAVVTAMKNTTPVLTNETTMWNAWIGFNASHSAGAIFIGLVNIILVVQYFHILQNSLVLLLLNITTATFYCWLGRKYWFRIPYTGILIATVCFVAASIIIFVA